MKTTYFFSGTNKPSLIEVLSRQKACGMVNALSAGEPKLRQAYERYPNVELVLDSGAVQGNRNVEGYARLIKSVQQRMSWIASLDVLHNQTASDEHFRQLQVLLEDDEQARTKLLWIYQCQSRGAGWHPDGDLDLLKRALEKRHLVGLGGFVSVIERNILEAQDLLGSIGEILEAAGAQAHVFGIGNYPLLTYCLAHSWFRSADSARWLQGLKSRTLLTTDGKVISGRTLTFNGMQIAEQNVGAMLAWLEPKSSRQLYLFPESDLEDALATRKDCLTVPHRTREEAPAPFGDTQCLLTSFVV